MDVLWVLALFVVLNVLAAVFKKTRKVSESRYPSAPSNSPPPDTWSKQRFPVPESEDVGQEEENETSEKDWEVSVHEALAEEEPVAKPVETATRQEEFIEIIRKEKKYLLFPDSARLRKAILQMELLSSGRWDRPYG